METMPCVTSNGTRIYWEEEGSGHPVLLIMGLGYALDMWHRTRPVLAKHYRIVLFDNRGVGKSDAPPGPYPIAQMAADAAAVLDAAGIESAHVIGVSMGGMIAQELALQYPARVGKLVLGCTACGGPKAVRAAKEVNDVLFARGAMTPEEAISAAIPFIYDPSTPRERIDEDLAIRRRAIPTGVAYLAQLMGILAWQSYDRLPGLKPPTLVIHGETDRLVPPGNGQLIADIIPGSRLVLIPHASHIFATDQPERAHAEMLAFLGS
jgi:3-oxoadipate enol-lactonase